MKMLARVLVVSALVCTGVSGCQQGAKDAGTDTAQSQVQAPAESVMTQAEKIPESAIVAEPQAKPAPQTKAQTTPAATPKTKTAQTPQVTAAAAAARADSVKQAQARAEATRVARLDSVKRADAAKAAVKTAPTAPPAASGEAALAAQGKEPYEANCRRCHGVLGVPSKSMQARFSKIATFDAAFFAKRSADSLVTVMTKGTSNDMKSYKDKLTHAQMVAVAAYIRSLAR